jgi:hypothetical protein
MAPVRESAAPAAISIAAAAKGITPEYPSTAAFRGIVVVSVIAIGNPVIPSMARSIVHCDEKYRLPGSG